MVDNNKQQPPPPPPTSPPPKQSLQRQDSLQKEIIRECQQIIEHGYRINNLIGSGSYANVYKAQQLQTNHFVAIKFINYNKCSNYYRNHFLRYEVHIIRILNDKPHANIVGFIEAFNIDQPINGYIIVMEFVENGTLTDQILKNGKLKEKSAKKLFRDICNGLLHMHNNHIAHRDLKLDNILLTNNNQPKICDFSLSIIWPSSSTNDDHQKKLCEDYCGTDLYYPPEVGRKIPYNPMAYDIWNCGICLFIITTKMFPFRSDDLNIVISHQMNRNYRLHQQYKQLSNDLKQLLSGMLEPDFQKRLTINEVLTSKWFGNSNSNSLTRTMTMTMTNRRSLSFGTRAKTKNRINSFTNKKRPK
ncbi:testis-specific serine/threonine-protein kinase 3-like [Dermatophagoides pteronyssinus]|uniref:testis-specific serine/threonine-protein kinase 3-like n=1 Tax=Dermatophagoides pteronyssinus TaxID=6956 RepID=UPI003F6774BC